MARRPPKAQIVREYYNGKFVIQVRDDGTVTEKNYNNVIQGLNGFYKNPKFPEMRDDAQDRMYRLAMDYYRYH
ncbi:BQ5605_C017g08426 [Microbotryum silenes-dioicae]|uniref:BQ5605_C017g08426 protein n=1 Tax=Microbotryum silenes-dioicae TaxID=796604 RepID=A0A2X0LYN8_9BASI|nr:BQ5605_C017g08426 [Microbotryum silenes-dioicae]